MFIVYTSISAIGNFTVFHGTSGIRNEKKTCKWFSMIIFSWVKIVDHIQKYLANFAQRFSCVKFSYRFGWGVGWKEEGRKLEEPGVCLQMPVEWFLSVVKKSERC
jgi:hypothetical protein